MPRSRRVRTALRDDRFWWWLGGTMLVALVVRVAWVAYAARPPLALYDPARYDAIAGLIAQGRGYVEPLTMVHGVLSTPQPSAYYPPGYPYFLGALDWLIRVGVLPHNLPVVAGMAQAVLGTITVAFLGVIGRRVWSPRAGVLAALLMAIYPNLVMHTSLLLGETLFNFLFLAFVAVVVTAPRAVGTRLPLPGRHLAAAGALLGLTVLVRPISLAALPVLLIVWWVAHGGWRPAVGGVAALVACVVLLVLPWTVRNEVRMHGFVPLSTNNGDNLCVAYSPGAKGAFNLSKSCDTKAVQNGGSRSEIEHDHQATSLALKYLRERPGRVPWLLKQRGYYLVQRGDDAIWAVTSHGLDRFMSQATFNTLDRITEDAWFTALATGLLGLVLLSVRGRVHHLLVVLLGVSTLIVPLATFADPRFTVPFSPFLLLGTAVLVARLTGSRPVDDAALVGDAVPVADR